MLTALYDLIARARSTQKGWKNNSYQLTVHSTACEWAKLAALWWCTCSGGPNTWTSAHGLHRNYTKIPNPSPSFLEKKTGLATRQPTEPNADGSSLIQEFVTGATTALVGKYLAPLYLLCHLLVFKNIGKTQNPWSREKCFLYSVGIVPPTWHRADTYRCHVNLANFS